MIAGVKLSEQPIELALHPAVARLHFGSGSYAAEGTFAVRRGRRLQARAVGAAMGLPPAGRAVRVRLDVERDDDQERWHRSFGGRSLDATVKRVGPDSILECFGPFEFRYDVQVVRGALLLRLASTQLRVGPVCIAIPRAIAPRIRGCVARGDGSVLRVSVVVIAPWGDLVVAYRGAIQEANPWT
jgi:hypothetical protein